MTGRHGHSFNESFFRDVCGTGRLVGVMIAPGQSLFPEHGRNPPDARLWPDRSSLVVSVQVPLSEYDHESTQSARIRPHRSSLFAQRRIIRSQMHEGPRTRPSLDTTRLIWCWHRSAHSGIAVCHFGSPFARRWDMLQGTLDMLVLQTLAIGPAHGHTIAHGIERGLQRHPTGRAWLVISGSLSP